MFKLSQRIKQRRKELGILQTDMEDLIGMKQAQYQKIEAGGNVNLKTLQRIFKALKLQLFIVPDEKMGMIIPLLGDEDAGSGLDQPLSLLDKFQVIDD